MRLNFQFYFPFSPTSVYPPICRQTVNRLPSLNSGRACPVGKYDRIGVTVDRLTSLFCGQLFPKAPKTKKFNLDLKSVNLTAENIRSFDAIVLSTDHDNFDYEMIEKEAKLIIDTRGRFKGYTNIFSA